MVMIESKSKNKTKNNLQSTVSSVSSALGIMLLDSQFESLWSHFSSETTKYALSHYTREKWVHGRL